MNKDLSPQNEPDGCSWKRLLLCVLISAVTLAAYYPAIRGGFIWDDDDYVTQNLHLRSAAGLARIWLDPGAVPQYYPLVHTTYWLEYRLWALEPLGYHLGNVLLHLLAALLAWRVLKQLAVPGAALAATLFALHPVHVESVAWITERKNVLSAVFYLGAALCYFRFAPAETNTLPEKTARSRFYFSCALTLFVAALLSKTVTASLPAALLVIIWWKQGRIPANRWKPLVAFFLLGTIASLHTIYLEKVRVGATGPDWDLSLIERCLVAGRATWFYLGKLAWPDPLVFFYPKWAIDAGVPWQYFYPAAALVLLGLLWKMRGHIGRGPLAAALFFGGTLLPALGFFDIYPMRFSFVADHFQYLASLGPITLAAATATLLWRKLPPPHALIGLVAAALLLLMLAFVSHRQAASYRDAETLWQRTIAANPQAFAAYHNLGTIRAGAGRYDEALAFWQQAQAIHESAETCRNIGQLHELRGDLEAALQCYQRALELQPNYDKALVRAADCYLALGRLEEAETSYRSGLKHEPKHPGCHLGLGLIHEMHGESAEAESRYRLALEADPGNARACVALALAALRQGKLKAAEEHLRRLLETNPEQPEAHYQLGMLLAHQEQFAAAERHFRSSLVKRPSHAPTHFALGSSLWQKGDRARATEHFRQAVQAAPGAFGHRMRLARVLAEQDMNKEAAAALRGALSLRPENEEALELLEQLEKNAPTTMHQSPSPGDTGAQD